MVLAQTLPVPVPLLQHLHWLNVVALALLQAAVQAPE
jgi:hypothetical protein